MNIVYPYFVSARLVFHCSRTVSKVPYSNPLHSALLSRGLHFTVLQKSSHKRNIEHVPNIKEFLSNIQKDDDTRELEEIVPPYLKFNALNKTGKKVYFETYGCQMNVNDAEYAWAILKNRGYVKTELLDEVMHLFYLLYCGTFKHKTRVVFLKFTLPCVIR